jgi:protein gp37
MKNSSIEWTDDTFKPWWGCTKVSPGCTHCYAETLSSRYGKDVWGPGKQRQRMSAKYWEGPLAWDRKVVPGEIRRVFCASMADVFDPDVPPEWRADLFELIRQTRNLSWLLLTKRPDEIPSLGLPPETVWLGTSVEDQRRADERIPQLLNIPATVHFLSVEPLLEAVDLGSLQGINWIICGGESGLHCRPMNVEWARSVRDQCKNASVAFFMKQMAGHPKGSNPIPADLMIREFPL